MQSINGKGQTLYSNVAPWCRDSQDSRVVQLLVVYEVDPVEDCSNCCQRVIGLAQNRLMMYFDKKESP